MTPKNTDQPTTEFPRAYAVVNERGNPILFNGQLPIYWRLNPAREAAVRHGGRVVRVEIAEVRR